MALRIQIDKNTKVDSIISHNPVDDYLRYTWNGVNAKTARNAVFNLSFDDLRVNEDLVRVMLIRIDNLVMDENGFRMNFNIDCVATESEMVSFTYDPQLTQHLYLFDTEGAGVFFTIAQYVHEAIELPAVGTPIEGRNIRVRYLTSDGQTTFETTYPGGPSNVTFGQVMREADDDEGRFHFDLV